MSDVKMFRLAQSSLVAERSRNIRIRAQNDWQGLHSSALEIVLRQFSLFQQLAHAHDVVFSTAERVLSSRPAVAVQAAATRHRKPTRCEFSVNVVTRPVSIKLRFDAVSLSRSLHESCQVLKCL